MNESFFQLFAICLVSCFCNFSVPVKSENALIFKQNTKQLDELMKYGNEFCQDCLTACPASSQLETYFTNYHSISKNALFVEHIYKDRVYARNMEINICDEPFKPIIVWDTSEKTHRIGYELYYKKTQNTSLKCDIYSRFEKIVYGKKESIPSTSRDIKRVRKYKDEDGNTVFELLNYMNTELVFYWIPVISIKSWTPVLVSLSKFNYRQISFEKDVMNIYKPQETMTECKEYNLGDGWQKVSTNEMTNETSKLPPWPPQNEPTPTPCSKTDENCKQLTQIMPMRYFHTTAAKLATCTYLNVAHIWKNIANGRLKKIDQYLYAVYWIWVTNDIKIIFGIQGELISEKNFLADSSYDGISNLSKNERNRIFPTPKIMYRLVKYEVKGNLYQTIVVIHNNPSTDEVTSEDRICREEDEVKGWDRIKNIEGEPGLSYACPLTKQTVERITVAKDAFLLSEALELNAFPKYDANIGGISRDDETENIEKEFEYITNQLKIFD
ncbi:uncharacterized protein LOC135848904 [Planococcus citri]|uniref:uncharacterized protein LOC135848904 n=1 Tax=Planococcus citri TaxID=170843 RepID=UPI0031F77611